MAAPIVKNKRSSVPRKIPTTTDLSFGEFGFNTYDGKVFISASNAVVGVGTTVITVNPWSVGIGSTAYNTYFNAGNVGIGTTNPTSTLQVQGTVSVSSTTTSAEFVGGASDLRNLSGTHLVSYASASDISNSALSISGISTYNQVGILTGSLATATNDNFGGSVATSADGKTIIVGASIDEIGATTETGIVYVFDRVGNSFNQVGILTGSLATATNDNFGGSVATSADGKTIIVGAIFDEGTGIVYVFDRVGNSFNQVGILTGSLATEGSDAFGYEVAISADGKTIIVGAPNDEIGATTETGVVYVFDRVGNSFNQVGILTGSLATQGSDAFGYEVATSADGKTIIVGAIFDEGTGVVYVFDRVGNSFNQVGILTGSLATQVSDDFGYEVATSADGKTIVVGAVDDEIGATIETGVVYVFDRVGNSFNQVAILTGSLALQAFDGFGNEVAISADGKTIIVGAFKDEIGATTGTGIVYVFDQIRDTYVYSGPTGNIGIGTTNPTSKLTVTGNVEATSFSGSGTNLTGIVTSIVAGTNITVSGSTGQVTINSSGGGGGESYWISTNVGIHTLSNVGIGTTNPTSKLTVQGDVNVSGVVTASSFSGNTSSSTYAITSGIATYATTAGIATYATTAGIATYATTAGIATYATTAGIATSVLTNPGVGIATAGGTVGTGATILDFRGSGISTVTVSAGIATINIIGTSGGGGGTIAVTDDTSTNATYYVGIASTTTGNLAILNISTTKLTFNPSTGNLIAGGTVTANSDQKLKTNIHTIENALDKVLSLRGVEYDRIDTGDHQIGVIAQEVERIIPDVVYGDEIKSVAYGNIVGLLIEAIKDQNKRIEELERKLEGN